METNAAYKEILAKVDKLRAQLKSCEEACKSIELAGINAEMAIDEHFTMCISHLMARKNMLRDECTDKVHTYKKKMEETKKVIMESIEGCAMTLEAGIKLYRSNILTAENVWKGTSSLQMPQIEIAALKTTLPMNSFKEIIDSHGKVELERPSDFAQAGNVATFAGSVDGHKDGKGTSAQLCAPRGMCWSPHDDCLYVCDHGNTALRKITMNGDVSTFYVSGTNASDQEWPHNIVMNHNTKDFFVCYRSSHTIYKINSLGSGSFFAGGGSSGYKDGIGSGASFCNPFGITIDQKTGDLFVSDENHVIRKITPAGEVSTVAGAGVAGFADGTGKGAKFKFPCGLAFDEIDQCLFVCDSNNNKLRRVTLRGDVTTACEIPNPVFVALTPSRTVIVSSAEGNKIYLVTKKDNSFSATILAGSGKKGRKDGKVEESGFNKPSGLVVHEGSRSVYVADSGSDTVRKITFL